MAATFQRAIDKEQATLCFDRVLDFLITMRTTGHLVRHRSSLFTVLNCSIVRRILALTMSRVAFLPPGVIYFPIVLITLLREEWVNTHSFVLLRPCVEREVPHAQIYIGQLRRADKVGG